MEDGGEGWLMVEFLVEWCLVTLRCMAWDR